jgi:transcription elongation factor Elf1
LSSKFIKIKFGGFFCFEVVLVDCSIDTYDGRRIEAFQICGLRTHVELNVNKSNNIKF